MVPACLNESVKPLRQVMRGLVQLGPAATDATITLPPIQMGSVFVVEGMTIGSNPFAVDLDGAIYLNTIAADTQVAWINYRNDNQSVRLTPWWAMAGETILCVISGAVAGAQLGVQLFGYQYDLVSPGPDNDKFFATAPGPQGVQGDYSETLDNSPDDHHYAPPTLTPGEVDDSDPLPLGIETDGTGDPDSTYR